MKHSDYLNKIFFLCMVLAIGRFAFDMYLPSLLVITDEFKVDYNIIERTVSSYLLGITFCQLIFGPLADCWGRKRILLFGFVLFCLGTVVCLFSQSANMLIFGRLLCGAGLSVGPCLKRALLVDWFDNKHLIAKASGTVSSVTMFATMIAPVLGGLLQGYTGSWRLSFLLIGIWGALLLYYITIVFQETKVYSGKFNLRIIMKDYLSISMSQNFLLFTVISSFAFANTIVYFQIIPYIFAIDLQASAEKFSYAASLAGFSYIIGAYILDMLKITSNKRLIIISLYVLILSSLAAWVLFVFCENKVFMAIPLFFFFVALRWILPATLAEAMTTQKKSGTASSVMGFMQYIFSTVLSYSFSFVGGPATACIFFIEILLGSIVILFVIQKWNEEDDILAVAH